jgi:hypothetical protein
MGLVLAMLVAVTMLMVFVFVAVRMGVVAHRGEYGIC